MPNDSPAKQSFLTAQAGIHVPETGAAFWKPDGRVRRITVLTARPPTAEEAAPRALKDRDGKPTSDTVSVLAVFDIEVDGAPHRWDVSSRRALAALDAAITGLPIDLTVQQKGSGKSTTYEVKVAPPELPKKAAAKPAADEPCSAPDCATPPTAYINSVPYCREHEKAARFKADVAAARAKEDAKEAVHAYAEAAKEA